MIGYDAILKLTKSHCDHSDALNQRNSAAASNSSNSSANYVPRGMNINQMCAVMKVIIIIIIILKIAILGN